MFFRLNTLFSACLFSVVFLAINSVQAQEAYGLFNVVKGDVQLLSGKDKKSNAAKVGLKVFSGDTVITGKEGRAKIVMSDKNVLNISPETKMVITRYENKGDSKNVEIKIEEGKVRASVEQKYNGDKNKFQIRTPSAVAGVRGTDFITKYETVSKQSQIITFTGTVAVANLGPKGEILKQVFVRPGESTSVKEGSAPEVPKALPSEQMKQMNNDSKAESTPGAIGQKKDMTDRAPASTDGQASNKEGDRAPQSMPSMVDAKDLSLEPGKEMMAGPAPMAGQTFNPNQSIPKPPMQNPLATDAARNLKTKTTVIVTDGQ